MTAIQGISAFYHDSVAALVVDGEIAAAAQEERFTRREHDAAFPVHAIRYCLAEAGLGTADLDQVVDYERPRLKLRRLVEMYLASAPAGLGSFRRAATNYPRRKPRQRVPSIGMRPVNATLESIGRTDERPIGHAVECPTWAAPGRFTNSGSGAVRGSPLRATQGSTAGDGEPGTRQAEETGP